MIALAFALSLGFVTGCDNGPAEVDDFELQGNILELASRSEVPYATGKPMSIDQMADTDVIVAVNGYPLTKLIFDDISVAYAKGLSDNGIDNQMVLGRKLEEYQKTYINKFIGQRILVDAAFAQGVVTTNQVMDHVRDKLREIAKAKKKSTAQIVKGYAPFERYFVYDLAISYVMSRMIEEKIPTLAKVDDNFVKAVQDEVSRMNDAAQTTNDLIKARLESWRGQIIENKIDFASVVREFSMDTEWKRNDPKDCAWGEFEESDMDDPVVASAVFALRKGEISDVLEDENGYHLVKVLDIRPPETNEEGRIVQKERRLLSHVYIQKEPLLIRQSDALMMTDVKWQMQAQAINRYIAAQITNGTTRVEYPHGKGLFK